MTGCSRSFRAKKHPLWPRRLPRPLRRTGLCRRSTSPARSDGPSFEEEEFPLGDGTAQTDAVILCPHCGEPNTPGLDPGSGAIQEYVEDCQVCCQPWDVRVTYREDGGAEIVVEAIDES